MVGITRPRTFRDVALVLIGAAGMHFTTSFLGPFTEHTSSIIVNTQVGSEYMGDSEPYQAAPVQRHDPPVHVVDHVAAPVKQPDAAPARGRQQDSKQELIKPAADVPPSIDVSHEIPETILVSHAPGWTVFRNLYMSNGTVYIVTSRPSRFPDILYMTSTGLPAENSPENIAARIPTSDDMSFLTPQEAQDRWGGDVGRGEKNRIWSVPGNTFIVNEPSQFLTHYYHFCAEWLFGAWAFWQGAHNAAVLPESASTTTAPPLDRVIFANANADGWRDRPGFNTYVFRSAFPAATVEVLEDWDDRIVATSNGAEPHRAWHFDAVLWSDRSASFKGPICGSQNQRIAAEAIDHMRGQGALTKLWWEPVRRAVLRFAGVDERTLDLGIKADAFIAAREKLKPQIGAAAENTKAVAGISDKEVVITYISRQSARRHLIDEDHDALVAALREMSTKHGWELVIVEAEKLSKEQQLQIAARTTVLLGVHGNGLTHLIMMPVTPVSTVIEIFYPGGFAHDYHWTSMSLGIRHYGIWNDTYFTHPHDDKNVDYPEGFQGTQIPVYAPTVVSVIEERIAGMHPFQAP